MLRTASFKIVTDSVQKLLILECPLKSTLILALRQLSAHTKCLNTFFKSGPSLSETSSAASACRQVWLGMALAGLVLQDSSL